jgi:hypothetical protein
LPIFCRVTGRRDQAQQGDDGRQRAGDVAIDCGSEDMKILPEEARAKITTVYTKQHVEAVNALSSAMERVKGTWVTVVKEDTKAETVSDSKPSLASLLLAGREE